jgi:hypothetical protein
MYTRTWDGNPYAYKGYHGRPAFCRMETWEEGRQASGPAPDGTAGAPRDVTNQIEVLAAQVVAQYFPQLFEALEETPFHIVGRYPPSRQRDDRRERRAFVTFPYRAPRTM